MAETAPQPETGWVSVAKLGKTRGLRGEITATGYASSFERYRRLKQVRLRKPDGTMALDGGVVEIESVSEVSGKLVFRFVGFGRIEDVEPLVNCDVVIPEAERPALPEGEYYLSDLLECEVIDRASGEQIGRVRGWQDFGGPVMEVEREPGDRNPIWIPLARSICPVIDLEARRILVDLPEGLKDLNAE